MQLHRDLTIDCEVVFEGRCADFEQALSDRALLSLDPTLSHRLRKALQETKDDVRDAQTLAQLRHLRPEVFRPIAPVDPSLRQLRKTARIRRALVHHRTKVLEQLQALRSRSRGQTETAWLQSFDGLPENALVQVLHALNQQIKTLERTLDKQGATQQDCSLLRTLPGMGSILSAEIAGELQGIAVSSSTQQVRAYAGTSPVTLSSGQSKIIRLRQRCNRRARNALFLFAFCSMRFHPWARQYYNTARQRGQTHSAALLALANRWMAVLCAMIRNNRTYDPLRKTHSNTEAP
jgi:transposase